MIILKKLKIAILLSLLIVSFDNVVLSNAVGFEGKIHKNIYVRDIDISNLTREEAKNKINKIIESNNLFILNLSENKYVFLKEDIDVDYNVDDLIETAYGIGRNEGIISNIKTIGNLRLGKKIILDYRITYDEKKLNKYLILTEKQYIEQLTYDKKYNVLYYINIYLGKIDDCLEGYLKLIEN